MTRQQMKQVESTLHVINWTFGKGDITRFVWLSDHSGGFVYRRCHGNREEMRHKFSIRKKGDKMHVVFISHQRSVNKQPNFI